MLRVLNRKLSPKRRSHHKRRHWLLGSLFSRARSRFLKRKEKQRSVIKLRSLGGKFQGYRGGEQLPWIRVISQIAGSVIPAILPWGLWFGGYGFFVSVLHFIHPEVVNAVLTDTKVLQNVILSFNVILSVLLVFRTNSAHERFWEGRKLWGSLVNTVRNLARDIWIVIEELNPKDRADKEATLRLVVAFAFAMKLHLRRDPVNDELVPLMSTFEYLKLKDTAHPSLEIAFWIGDYLQNQYARERTNIFQLAALQKLVDDLVDILGGCERILKTPVPVIYTILLKTLLVIYFLALPWELVDGLTWWTGPILTFIALILVGIDEIGAEIEEPFGHDPNDLPLDLICNTILQNVEHLIETAPSTRYFCDLPNTTANAGRNQ